MLLKRIQNESKQQEIYTYSMNKYHGEEVQQSKKKAYL